MNKHLLSVVVGFLDLKGPVTAVCKYWSEVATESRVQIVDRPEHFYRPKTIPIIRKRNEVKKVASSTGGTSGGPSTLTSASTSDGATTGTVEVNVGDNKSESPTKGSRVEFSSVEAGGATGGVHGSSKSRSFSRPRQVPPSPSGDPKVGPGTGGSAGGARSRSQHGDESAAAGALAAAAAASASKQSIYVITHPQMDTQKAQDEHGGLDGAAAGEAAAVRDDSAAPAGTDAVPESDIKSRRGSEAAGVVGPSSSDKAVSASVGAGAGAAGAGGKSSSSRRAQPESRDPDLPAVAEGKGEVRSSGRKEQTQSRSRGRRTDRGSNHIAWY